MSILFLIVFAILIWDAERKSAEWRDRVIARIKRQRRR